MLPPHAIAALTIAGSDSSGGAGIQADLKTFSAFGVYGASAITALTAQNTLGVQGVLAIPHDFVARQLASVFSDLQVGAVKTGMLANAAIVAAVARELSEHGEVPLIVDPVMVSTSGDALLDADAVEALRRELIARAELVTPNLPEAARLTGEAEARNEPQIVAQARAIAALGCRAVLIKGGHASGSLAVDVLYENQKITRFVRPRIDTPHTHGAGCTLAAAITALRACQVALPEAIERAKLFVSLGLEHGRKWRVGHGRGPLDHLYAIRGAKPPA